ncbi:MAG: aldehyde dehydrogenase family protein, partial [Pseudomonadota bacterium]
MDTISTILTPPETARKFGFFIDGTWREAGDREVFLRASPGHGLPVTEIPKCTTADLDDAVSAARKAFEDRRWSGLSGAERASVLLKAADGIRARRDEIAYWETLENGKPISQSRAEVDGCVSIFEYAAGAARALHGDSFNNLGDGMFGLVTREPIGVVGLITPWNFPFLILCERVPFILASGCTIVAKPSEVTSATTLMMAEILAEAGLPDGCYNVVTGSGRTIGQALTEHMDIDMVSFTGSTAVGRSCLQAAGGNFKKLGLELGGKNPQIVFADADLEDAADGVAFGIGFNTGQCCVSGSRLVVERSVAEDFEKLVAAKFA